MTNQRCHKLRSLQSNARCPTRVLDVVIVQQTPMAIQQRLLCSYVAHPSPRSSTETKRNHGSVLLTSLGGRSAASSLSSAYVLPTAAATIVVPVSVVLEELWWTSRCFKQARRPLHPTIWKVSDLMFDGKWFSLKVAPFLVEPPSLLESENLRDRTTPAITLC